MVEANKKPAWFRCGFFVFTAVSKVGKEKEKDGASVICYGKITKLILFNFAI